MGAFELREQVQAEVRGAGDSVSKRPVGRQTEIVTIRLPSSLLEDLDARKGARSAIVRHAIDLMLYGDAEKWERRFKEEQTKRLALERRLQRVREAVE